MKIIPSILVLTISLSLFAQEKEETPKLRSNSVYAGYSALIPGFGQIKKDRVYTGIFILTIFGASVWNLKQNYENFHSEGSNYEQNMKQWFLLKPSNLNVEELILVSSIIANQNFKHYADAADKTNNAIQYMGLIYFAQIVHAYFCSPGLAFQKNLESKVSDTSNFHFSFSPTRNQFGQPGMNLNINYTWRF